MGMLEAFDDPDCDQWETYVSIHSPVVRSTQNGNYFTTYSISLRSNNSCFSQPYSCTHRRYSEFVHLRNLLKEQHPAVEPPPLPPKKLFRRFDQSFINQRTEGLQTFVRKVLDTSVYLSNKAVHLFLQSNFTMSEIDRQVLGGSSSALSSECFSDSCSDTSSEHTDGAANRLKDLEEFSQVANANKSEEVDEVGVDAKVLVPESEDAQEQSTRQQTLTEPIPILQPYLRSSLIRSACNSLNTSPRLSPTSSSADSGLVVSRRVSFCNKVKVAVVQDQMWNIGTRPIRTCAW